MSASKRTDAAHPIRNAREPTRNAILHRIPALANPAPKSIRRTKLPAVRTKFRRIRVLRQTGRNATHATLANNGTRAKTVRASRQIVRRTRERTKPVPPVKKWKTRRRIQVPAFASTAPIATRAKSATARAIRSPTAAADARMPIRVKM